MVYPLKIVISHSYVGLPQGKGENPGFRSTIFRRKTNQLDLDQVLFTHPGQTERLTSEARKSYDVGFFNGWVP
jgi:hypothetical protein